MQDAHGFFAKAGGDNFEFLLISTEPGNFNNLAAFAREMRANDGVLFNLCTEGFKGVQFVTRDANLNQHLITKFPTSLKDSLRYMQRTAGATPVD